MKSMWQEAPSRSAGCWRDALLIYVATLMVGAAPFLFLYWLYKPTLLTNPGLNAYKAPIATLLLPPLRESEPFTSAEPWNEGSAAELAEDFAPELNEEKPKKEPHVAGPHPVVSVRQSRIDADRRTRAPARSAKTNINDPGQLIGTGTKSAASAYAYAPDERDHRRW
jgi:hypothetical protein